MPNTSVVIRVITSNDAYKISVSEDELLPRSPKFSCTSLLSERSADSNHRVSVEMPGQNGKNQVIYSQVPLSLLASTFKPIAVAVDLADEAAIEPAVIEKIILPRPTFIGKRAVLDVLTTSRRRQKLKDNMSHFDNMLDDERMAGTCRQIWLSLIPDVHEHWYATSILTREYPEDFERQEAKIDVTQKIVLAKEEVFDTCPTPQVDVKHDFCATDSAVEDTKLLSTPASGSPASLARMVPKTWVYAGAYQRAIEDERIAENNDDLAGCIM